jgi:hypothetical protein
MGSLREGDMPNHETRKMKAGGRHYKTLGTA